MWSSGNANHHHLLTTSEYLSITFMIKSTSLPRSPRPYLTQTCPDLCPVSPCLSPHHTPAPLASFLVLNHQGYIPALSCCTTVASFLPLGLWMRQSFLIIQDSVQISPSGKNLPRWPALSSSSTLRSQFYSHWSTFHQKLWENCLDGPIHLFLTPFLLTSGKMG